MIGKDRSPSGQPKTKSWVKSVTLCILTSECKLPEVLSRRIRLTVKSFPRSRSLPLFSRPLHLIQEWWCMEKLDAYHSYGFKSQFPNILQCYDQQTLIVWSPCSLNWINYLPQSQWYLLPFLWLIIQRVKHGRTMIGLCGFLTALYKMRAPQLSVTTLTRRKQAKLLKKKKKKPAVLRRACPQYGGGGSFTITISTIRHTEYSFILFFYCFIFYFALWRGNQGAC